MEQLTIAVVFAACCLFFSGGSTNKDEKLDNRIYFPGTCDDGPECSETSARFSNITTSYHFTCGSGEKISVTRVCDGRVDCKDGSDDCFATCRVFPCPRYLFRCGYGGCVDRHVACDGKVNCLDGTDELLPECVGTLGENGHCGDEKFQCASGECVSKNSPCDGCRDCSDHSDETFTVCNSFRCPQYAFRCAYGGCVDREKVCDGKSDCFDCSDEDHKMCGLSGPSSGCRLPAPIYHGSYRITNCPDSDLVACPLVPAGIVPNLTELEFNCQPAHRLVGPAKLKCVNNSWPNRAPYCIRDECGKWLSKDYQLFPWNVEIFRVKNGMWNLICAGTLISDEAILTAANCIAGRRPSDILVLPGTNVTRNLKHLERVWKISVHPQYHDAKYDNDLAILFLNNPVRFTNALQPVCLDSSKKSPLLNILQGKVVSQTKDLLGCYNGQSVAVQQVERAACLEGIPEDFKPYLTPDKFCATREEFARVPVCGVDHGGGLMVQDGTSGTWFIRGVSSLMFPPMGSSNCRLSNLTLYTDLTSHMPWILSALEAYKSQEVEPRISTFV